MSMEYTLAEDYLNSIDAATARMREIDQRIMNRPTNMTMLKEIDRAMWLMANHTEKITPIEVPQPSDEQVQGEW